MALQESDMNMLETRVMFDDLIKKYPIMGKHLDAKAKIVNNPSFECAIIKLQKGQDATLTSLERRIISNLKINNDDNATTQELPQKRQSFADISREKAKRFKGAVVEKSIYIDTLFIMPTSNLVERLFSQGL